LCDRIERLHQEGKYFVVENPLSSKCWYLPCFKRIRALKGVFLFPVHFCQFGTKYQKSTGLLTNWPSIGDLSQPCCCPRPHEEWLQWSATTKASRYPELFGNAVALLVVRDQLCSCRHSLATAMRLLPHPSWLQPLLLQPNVLPLDLAEGDFCPPDAGHDPFDGLFDPGEPLQEGGEDAPGAGEDAQEGGEDAPEAEPPDGARGEAADPGAGSQPVGGGRSKLKDRFALFSLLRKQKMQTFPASSAICAGSRTIKENLWKSMV